MAADKFLKIGDAATSLRVKLAGVGESLLKAAEAIDGVKGKPTAAAQKIDGVVETLDGAVALTGKLSGRKDA